MQRAFVSRTRVPTRRTYVIASSPSSAESAIEDRAGPSTTLKHPARVVFLRIAPVHGQDLWTLAQFLKQGPVQPEKWTKPPSKGARDRLRKGMMKCRIMAGESRIAVSSAARTPPGKERTLGSAMTMDHAAGRLAQQVFEPAAGLQVKVERNLQQFEDLRLFRRIACHGCEDSVAVEQMGNIEDALSIRVVRGDIRATTFAVDLIECLSTPHQIGLGHIHPARRADSVPGQWLSGPGLRQVKDYPVSRQRIQIPPHDH